MVVEPAAGVFVLVVTDERVSIAVCGEFFFFSSFLFLFVFFGIFLLPCFRCRFNLIYLDLRRRNRPEGSKGVENNLTQSLRYLARDW